MRSWLDGAVEVPPDVQEELDKALSESPDEALADLYANLVAGPRRRILGTFFTPVLEAASLLELWDASQEAPTDVTDVGAGVGVFTAAAASRWPRAHVTAVDVNPVTLALLGARMSQPDVSGSTGRVELVLEDFTTWLPRQTPSPGARRLTLGNPPYTRGQLIPAETRSRLAEETAQLCGSRASLSTYITALSLQHLEPDDGLCLLLPAQWLEADYAHNLRRYLLAATSRRVDLRLVSSAWFKDATVDAVVLLVGTQRDHDEPFTIAEWGSHSVRTVDRKLVAARGWRTWFNAPTASQDRRSENVRLLGDIARVRRGTATGANEFFLLSDGIAEEFRLPDKVLVPVVRRLSGYANKVTHTAFNAQSATGRSWLLLATKEDAQHPAVAAYLEYGLEQKYAQRHLCKVRAGEWYDLNHDLFVPDVIITAMTRGGFRVVENGIQAAITNNLYGWEWKPGITTKKQQAAVLAWLRSGDGQAALLAVARSQGNGLNKVEPAALAGLRLPAASLEK
jgi:tRNA1(Val) A37 N6-methylase TrmN6